MATTNTTKVQLIGFLPALTLILITLKLCGVIDWWWLFVLGPLWIPPVCMFLFGVSVVLFVLIGSLALALYDKYRKR
jgi:hypothetical protein